MIERASLLEMRLSYAGLLLVLIGLSIAPWQSAWACSCNRSSAEQAIRHAGAIFQGRVVSVRQVPWERDRDNATVIATVEVTDRWRGNVGDRVDVYSHTISSACGYTHFPVGDTMTFYASSRAQGGFSVSQCSMYQLTAPDFGAAVERYRAARNVHEAAVAAAPQSPRPLIELGRFLEEWQDWSNAAETYGALVQLQPRSATAQAALGRSLYRAGRFADAVPPLLIASGLAPPDSDTTSFLRLARLRSGDREAFATGDLRDLVLSDIDLSGLDLRGRDLSRTRFEGGRFVGISLEEASLVGTSLRGDFSGANLRGARIEGTLFWNRHNGSYSGIDLRGASGAASMYNAIFDGALLDGASLTGARLNATSFVGVDFGTADLSRAQLHTARLEGADLSRATLDDAEFYAARFDCRTRFPPGFNPNDRGLIGTDRACVGVQDFSGQSWRSLNLDGLDLSGNIFRNTIISGQAQNANFARADLRSAFFNADLRDANLRDADLRGATIIGDLRGADLRGSRLEGVTFRNVQHDATTRWPWGFTPP
ncbi:pentapeptide repeat-containing protein [Roseomonas sp. CAU 1739]|uniref:pentapeptide repeat-containing protein n=1 Tax=Roseomonas sp. CAU 1739 TaxID=3140364 RepID=UPI00325BF985